MLKYICTNNLKTNTKRMNTIEKLIVAIAIALITGLFMVLAIISNNTGNCEGCVLSDTKIENEENIDTFINSLNIN